MARGFGEVVEEECRGGESVSGQGDRVRVVEEMRQGQGRNVMVGVVEGESPGKSVTGATECEWPRR